MFWQRSPYLKKHISAFLLEGDWYESFKGQENWQAESILLVVDTFSNTAQKWPSFLETKGFSISLCLANQCSWLGFPITCQLLGLPSIYFPTCVPAKPFTTSFILSSLDSKIPRRKGILVGKGEGKWIPAPLHTNRAKFPPSMMAHLEMRPQALVPSRPCQIQ